MMKVVHLAVRFGSSARALLRRPRTSEWTEEETFSDSSRWQSVTILAAAEEIAPDGRLPAPLADLADIIDTRLEPAPGSWGTELSARSKLPPRADSASWKGKDLSREIRVALQHAKQLIEVGEVLSVEPQPAGRRRRAAGLLLDLMSGHADQEGVL